MVFELHQAVPSSEFNSHVHSKEDDFIAKERKMMKLGAIAESSSSTDAASSSQSSLELSSGGSKQAGIGLILQVAEGHGLIVQGLARSLLLEEEQSMVEVGDIVESIDGMSVIGWKLRDVSPLLLGESCSLVTLGILRKQGTRSFVTLTRLCPAPDVHIQPRISMSSSSALTSQFASMDLEKFRLAVQASSAAQQAAVCSSPSVNPTTSKPPRSTIQKEQHMSAATANHPYGAVNDHDHSAPRLSTSESSSHPTRASFVEQSDSHDCAVQGIASHEHKQYSQQAAAALEVDGRSNGPIPTHTNVFFQENGQMDDRQASIRALASNPQRAQVAIEELLDEVLALTKAIAAKEEETLLLREEVSAISGRMQQVEYEESLAREAMSREICELRDLALSLQRELARAQRRADELDVERRDSSQSELRGALLQLDDTCARLEDAKAREASLAQRLLEAEQHIHELEEEGSRARQNPPEALSESGGSSSMHKIDARGAHQMVECLSPNTSPIQATGLEAGLSPVTPADKRSIAMLEEMVETLLGISEHDAETRSRDLKQDNAGLLEVLQLLKVAEVSKMQRESERERDKERETRLKMEVERMAQESKALQRERDEWQEEKENMEKEWVGERQEWQKELESLKKEWMGEKGEGEKEREEWERMMSSWEDDKERMVAGWEEEKEQLIDEIRQFEEEIRMLREDRSRWEEESKQLEEERRDMEEERDTWEQQRSAWEQDKRAWRADSVRLQEQEKQWEMQKNEWNKATVAWECERADLLRARSLPDAQAAQQQQQHQQHQYVQQQQQQQPAASRGRDVATSYTQPGLSNYIPAASQSHMHMQHTAQAPAWLESFQAKPVTSGGVSGAFDKTAAAAAAAAAAPTASSHGLIDVTQKANMMPQASIQPLKASKAPLHVLRPSARPTGATSTLHHHARGAWSGLSDALWDSSGASRSDSTTSSATSYYSQGTVAAEPQLVHQATYSRPIRDGSAMLPSPSTPPHTHGRPQSPATATSAAAAPCSAGRTSSSPGGNTLTSFSSHTAGLWDMPHAATSSSAITSVSHHDVHSRTRAYTTAGRTGARAEQRSSQVLPDSLGSEGGYSLSASASSPHKYLSPSVSRMPPQHAVGPLKPRQSLDATAQQNARACNVDKASTHEGGYQGEAKVEEGSAADTSAKGGREGANSSDSTAAERRKSKTKWPSPRWHRPETGVTR